MYQVCIPDPPGKPVQARHYSTSKEQNESRKRNPKFTHFEKWETAVAHPWIGLLSIPGQYNDCNNLHECCTGFVL
jgi:hypothetical protein